MPAELIAIGIVKRPVGLDGFCAVGTFGDTFGLLKTPCAVWIGRDAGSATEIVVKKIVLRPAGYQCRFEGVDDRTAIERLRGQTLFTGNDRLPDLGRNEFYHFELKGMTVVDEQGGNRIGTVVEVHNFPSMDTLEVAPDKGETILVPLNGQAIESIDKQAGRITVFKNFIEELLQ